MRNVEFFPVVMGTVMQWYTDYHGIYLREPLGDPPIDYLSTTDNQSVESCHPDRREGSAIGTAPMFGLSTVLSINILLNVSTGHFCPVFSTQKDFDEVPDRKYSIKEWTGHIFEFESSLKLH